MESTFFFVFTYMWFIATQLAKWMQEYLSITLERNAEASFLLEAWQTRALLGSSCIPMILVSAGNAVTQQPRCPGISTPHFWKA